MRRCAGAPISARNWSTCAAISPAGDVVLQLKSTFKDATTHIVMSPLEFMQHKRVFDIDIENCPNCGGALKIIAAIEDPPVIVKILSHLGLPTRAPAQRFDLFQTT